jgi:translation initiation factor IF-2
LPQRSRLEAFYKGIEPDASKILNVILKADVAGSVEAIAGALNEIESTKISVHVLHSGAGPLTESDILLASASDAVCIGFNVKVESNAVRTAKREGVQVKLYSIIYELIDQIKEAMLGLLDPEMRETKLGHAKVKQVFKVSRGRVAGCLVTDGRINRSARARVLRGDQPVYDGAVQTLRRFEDDVQEVKTGLECGIRLGDFNEYQVDDVIECYRLDKIDQTL